MNAIIHPSKVSGTITAPPSKSVTHRAIILAALAHGKSVIKNPLLSEDTKHTIKALKAFGVKIEENNDELIIHGTSGNITAPNEPINLGNSGTSMRLLAGVATLTKGKTTLTGEKRLLERPVGNLIKALNDLGIKTSSNPFPPIEIHGSDIKGGNLSVAANLSSQYVSSLLLIAPFAKEQLTITPQILQSKPYVAITIDLMKKFGVKVFTDDNFEKITVFPDAYKAQEYIVEGDYSSASYAFAAAAVTGGNVSVKGLNPYSKQGDAYFLKILEEMCCDVSIHGNTITVNKSKVLKPVIVDMGDYPDIVQSLTVVAAYANGKTRITNIGHLRHKETDRINKPSAELKKMGIKVTVDDNSMTITGGKPKGAAIDTHNDHRMAMAFAVAALGSQGTTTIEHAEVVNKSYPEFWHDLESIGVSIKTYD